LSVYIVMVRERVSVTADVSKVSLETADVRCAVRVSCMSGKTSSGF
jgi:hypothetical protein